MMQKYMSKTSIHSQQEEEIERDCEEERKDSLYTYFHP